MENDELLFETHDADIQRGCPVGSQFYSAETDAYYIITRIVLAGGVYRLYGESVFISELIDDSE